MEAIRALIRGELPPAGYPIVIQTSTAPETLFDEYNHYWLDSGTSALAMALMDCKQRHIDVENPQVIIPGYCCPDLVAAAVYAGVTPLVVDIAIDDAAYDLDQLKAAINSNVIAVIAINFLGIKENLSAIRELTTNHCVELIEDNAQWFPENTSAHFLSDYVVFSFGRGKPLSLLAGGLLLAKKAVLKNPLENNSPSSSSWSLKDKSKLHAYNLLLHPQAYCFLKRAPFITLGETRLHLHEKITAMPALAKSLFAANRQAYCQRSEAVANCYREWFSDAPIQFFKVIDSARSGRLLRYPLLLADAEQCQKLHRLLDENGLGASLMYQQELNAIEGVADKVVLHSPLLNARSFAKRLLTLPLHAYVTPRHLDKMHNIIFDKV
jgi:dTDP-4-amino-4,6-dideoxygalactose transaminase